MMPYVDIGAEGTAIDGDTVSRYRSGYSVNW